MFALSRRCRMCAHWLFLGLDDLIVAAAHSCKCTCVSLHVPASSGIEYHSQTICRTGSSYCRCWHVSLSCPVLLCCDAKRDLASLAGGEISDVGAGWVLFKFLRAPSSFFSCFFLLHGEHLGNETALSRCKCL